MGEENGASNELARPVGGILLSLSRNSTLKYGGAGGGANKNVMHGVSLVPIKMYS